MPSAPAQIAPMEAESVDSIPVGPEWQYEPKWDGFRCIAQRAGTTVELQSKSGQSLARYFPEIVDVLKGLDVPQCVLDGEIVIPAKGQNSFDDLLQRIHPAESRIRKLALETPAQLVVFDLLENEKGQRLLDAPLRTRRPALEAFAKQHFPKSDRIQLSPATTRLAMAKKWFLSAGTTYDGLIAKRLDLSYTAGERTGMQKIKPLRTADCVVGGFRYGSKERVVGSLLLGLYNDAGKLDHVGFCSGIKNADRASLTRKLEALRGGTGFTGRAPGGPSRWSTTRSSEWQSLEPKLVVEVSFDHVTADRFRHGTGFLRWRPDKSPKQCQIDQLHQKAKLPPVSG